jgi:RNA polymerase sigma-70 factor (ECF subfamily)
MNLAALPGETAFEQLYRSCYAGLVGQLFLITVDRTEAEEAVQEAFARLWVKWRDLQDYDNHEAWVRHVAVNVAISRWRRHARSVPLHEAGDLAARPDMGRGDLVVALRALPAKQRQALVLHHVVGLSVAEVAAEMSARTGTVKSWLSRGRAALERLLHDKEATPNG